MLILICWKIIGVRFFQSADATYHRMAVHPTLALLQYFHTTVAETSATF